MSLDRAERKLAAILSADAVGYSRLMAEDDRETLRTLKDHVEVTGALVRQHRGRVVDSPGDNLLAEFPSALDAVEAALEIQRVIGARNQTVPADRRMQYRVGIHLGDVMVDGERIYGDGVNIAARLEALAEPGGTCVSGAVHDQLGNKLRVSYADLGPQSLKNIPTPVRAYRIRAAEPPASTATRGRRPLLAVGAIALLAVAGFAAWRLLPRAEDAAAPAGAIRSLAVLPLENLSGDPTQEYFADGMTEALIADLGKIGALRVTSRTSVMQYKGARKPLREIAVELGVDALLEGTVMRDGERVRVTAQLIDARSDHHLWSERYDRELRGVLKLQSDVSRAVAREVELELSPVEVARLANRDSVGPAAHDALLKGIYQLDRATLESTRLAIESFERAIELEPDYALAHAWLGFAWWRRTQWFGFGAQGPFGAQEVVPPLEGMPKAKAAVLRALELDDALPEAYEGLGRLAGTFDWDFPEAVRLARRALELNPSLPWAHLGLGYNLGHRGRHDEGIAEGRRAVELAPFDLSVRTSLAEQYLNARRYDDALAEARKIIEMDPGFGAAHRVLSRIHEALRHYEDAIGDLERGKTLSREQASELRTALSREGPHGYWRGMLRIVRSQPVARPDLLAKCHGELGELDSAFAELERAYAARIGQLVGLRVNPAFDSLRDDPRFDELVRRVGIPES